MKYLKKFESEKKTFSSWLKNPSKPVKSKKYDYVISYNFNKKVEFQNDGMISIRSILSYIDEYFDNQIIYEISSFHNIENILDEEDDEKLEDILEEFIKDSHNSNYHSMDSFIEYYLDYDDSEISNDDRSNIDAAIEDISTDELWFDIIKIDVLSKRNISFLPLNNDKINIHVKISRKLDEEEIESLISIITDKIDNVQNLRTEPYFLGSVYFKFLDTIIVSSPSVVYGKPSND